MQCFSKWLKLWLLLLFSLLCCSFAFISAPPVASWDRKIRSADRIFDFEIVIRSADRRLDLEILIRSADRIQFIWYFSFKMKKHLKIKFSSFDTFCLILKIKQMAPLGFGIEPLFKFFMATMLGLFLYFKIALNIGWEILVARESVSWYSGIFKFLTAFEINEFKISAFSPSSLIIPSPSTNVIFFRPFHLI